MWEGFPEPECWWDPDAYRGDIDPSVVTVHPVLQGAHVDLSERYINYKTTGFLYYTIEEKSTNQSYPTVLQFLHNGSIDHGLGRVRLRSLHTEGVHVGYHQTVHAFQLVTQGSVFAQELKL